jgi:hypothetical protein
VLSCAAGLRGCHRKQDIEKKDVVSHDMTSLMCPALKTEEACCSNVFGLNLSLMMMQQSQWNPIK